MRGTQVAIYAGVLGLLIGAASTMLYVHLHAPKASKGGMQGLTADDSPVTVQGGTLEALAAGTISGSQTNTWTSGPTCSTVNQSWYFHGADDKDIYIDGVEPKNGSSASTMPMAITAIGLNIPWKIVLSMRQPDTSDPTGKHYKDDNSTQIAVSNYDLCTENPPTAATGHVYIADITTGTHKLYQNADYDYMDNVGRVMFDVSNCGGIADIDHSGCNHVSLVDIGTLPGFKDAGGNQITATQFECRAGACSIGIGKPQ